mmetsp:Transcript_11983/g.28731  ORF Transcript_11983/g.28731 Transcript_11983/m.28731 type:complete len:246 (+) Transcript_11983:22-759(+)
MSTPYAFQFIFLSTAELTHTQSQSPVALNRQQRYITHMIPAQFTPSIYCLPPLCLCVAHSLGWPASVHCMHCKQNRPTAQKTTHMTCLPTHCSFTHSDCQSDRSTPPSLSRAFPPLSFSRLLAFAPSLLLLFFAAADPASAAAADSGCCPSSLFTFVVTSPAVFLEALPGEMLPVVYVLLKVSSLASGDAVCVAFAALSLSFPPPLRRKPSSPLPVVAFLPVSASVAFIMVVSLASVRVMFAASS